MERPSLKTFFTQRVDNIKCSADMTRAMALVCMICWGVMAMIGVAFIAKDVPAGGWYAFPASLIFFGFAVAIDRDRKDVKR